MILEVAILDVKTQQEDQLGETRRSHYRHSQEYLEWKKLLHHYYDSFPSVEHYETIIEVNK